MNFLFNEHTNWNEQETKRIITGALQLPRLSLVIKHSRINFPCLHCYVALVFIIVCCTRGELIHRKVFLPHLPDHRWDRHLQTSEALHCCQFITCLLWLTIYQSLIWFRIQSLKNYHNVFPANVTKVSFLSSMPRSVISGIFTTLVMTVFLRKKSYMFLLSLDSRILIKC